MRSPLSTGRDWGQRCTSETRDKRDKRDMVCIVCIEVGGWCGLAAGDVSCWRLRERGEAGQWGLHWSWCPHTSQPTLAWGRLLPLNHRECDRQLRFWVSSQVYRKPFISRQKVCYKSSYIFPTAWVLQNIHPWETVLVSDGSCKSMM